MLPLEELRWCDACMQQQGGSLPPPSGRYASQLQSMRLAGNAKDQPNATGLAVSLEWRLTDLEDACREALFSASPVSSRRQAQINLEVTCSQYWSMANQTWRLGSLNA